MQKKYSNILFGVATSLLILFIAFMVTETVESQDKGVDRVDAKHYRQLENEYIKEIRTVLMANGIHNSGINMTHVTYEAESREYTVLIHHKKLSQLEQEEQMELEGQLNNIQFPIAECTFTYEYASLQ